MINKPPPLKDLNIRILIIIPIKGTLNPKSYIRIPMIVPIKGREFTNRGRGVIN